MEFGIARVASGVGICLGFRTAKRAEEGVESGNLRGDFLRLACGRGRQMIKVRRGREVKDLASEEVRRV